MPGDATGPPAITQFSVRSLLLRVAFLDSELLKFWRSLDIYVDNHGPKDEQNMTLNKHDLYHPDDIHRLILPAKCKEQTVAS